MPIIVAVLSARDKFKMLDQQNSATKVTPPRPLSASFALSANQTPKSPMSPTTPINSNNNFKLAKERLLQWAQDKTRSYAVRFAFISFLFSCDELIRFIHVRSPQSEECGYRQLFVQLERWIGLLCSCSQLLSGRV
jgi:hypothetical protein